jgi:hypothetical protein
LVKEISAIPKFGGAAPIFSKNKKIAVVENVFSARQELRAKR